MGEVENMTLQSWGVGTRLNVADDIALRVEIGWPTGSPNLSDGDHTHPRIEFITKF